MSAGDRQPVPKVSMADVERVVRRDFGPSGTEEVVAILDGFRGGSESGAARVRLAILKLSEGDLDLVGSYAEMARRDFRDVLLNAEYPRYADLTWEKGEPPAHVARRAIEEDWAEYQRWLGRACERRDDERTRES